MDVSFLCSSTTPAIVPVKESTVAALGGKKQQEDRSGRPSQRDADAGPEPHARRASCGGVQDKPDEPETYNAGYSPAAATTAESAPAAPLCPPQLPSRTECRDFAPPPFSPTQVRRKDPSSREEFSSTAADSERSEQWHTRNCGASQLTHLEPLEGCTLASRGPAVGVPFQPHTAQLRGPGKLRTPTFPPVQPYAYSYGAGLYGAAHEYSTTDVRLCLPPVQQEASSLYPYAHGQPHQPGYPPFPPPSVYYGSLPAYRAGNTPFAFGAEKYAHPGRRPSLPPGSSEFIVDCDRIYENCTVMARFAVGMGDEARQTNTRPLPPLEEFEIRDLILRAHDVLRTLAALGGYSVPVVLNTSPPASDGDGGVARHAEWEVAVSAGTSAERGNQPKLKYRKRRKGGNAGETGRCHSCNVSETPEWRRGPDGARTLCNACGLHFAKLRRKQLSEMMRLEETKLVTATNPSPSASGLSSACSASGPRDNGGDEVRPDTARRQSVSTSSLSSTCTLAAEQGLNSARGGDGLLDKATVAGLPSSYKAENVSAATTAAAAAPEQMSAKSTTAAAAGDDPMGAVVPTTSVWVGHPHEMKASNMDGSAGDPLRPTPFF